MKLAATEDLDGDLEEFGSFFSWFGGVTISNRVHLHTGRFSLHQSSFQGMFFHLLLRKKMIITKKRNQDFHLNPSTFATFLQQIHLWAFIISAGQSVTKGSISPIIQMCFKIQVRNNIRMAYIKFIMPNDIMQCDGTIPSEVLALQVVHHKSCKFICHWSWWRWWYRPRAWRAWCHGNIRVATMGQSPWAWRWSADIRHGCNIQIRTGTT